MFSETVAPDYRVVGLKYRREAGALRGKLYSALPYRFKSAGVNAFKAGIAAVLIFAGLFALAGVPYGFIIAGLVFGLVFLIGYVVFVIYDPGKTIRITKDELRIGLNRYRLSSVSSFYQNHYLNAQNKVTGYCIAFRYGRREVEIPIFNNREVIESLIPFLNDTREAITEEKLSSLDQQPSSPAALRSAEF